VQTIGTGVVKVRPGDYFELIAPPDLRRHDGRRRRRADVARDRGGGVM
jgi:hypothetical protein